MPCETVTVTGPDATVNVQWTSTTITSTGVNQANASGTLENTGNADAETTVYATVNGTRVSGSDQTVTVPAGGDAQVSIDLSFNVSAGRTEDKNICIQTENTTAV